MEKHSVFVSEIFTSFSSRLLSRWDDIHSHRLSHTHSEITYPLAPTRARVKYVLCSSNECAFNYEPFKSNSGRRCSYRVTQMLRIINLYKQAFGEDFCGGTLFQGSYLKLNATSIYKY